MNSGKPAALAAAMVALIIMLVGALPASGRITIGGDSLIRQDSSGVSIDLPDGIRLPEIEVPLPRQPKPQPEPEAPAKPDCPPGTVENVEPDGNVGDPPCKAPEPDASSDSGDRKSSPTRERSRERSRTRQRSETRRRARRERSERRTRERDRGRRTDGAPSNTNPSLTVADVGPAPIGVPNVVIDRFRIPPFLLPIYQAAGVQYGIRWEILAAINEIETDYGRNLNVSSAGAVGWMQFMPPTWRAYGVDANGDGKKDPYNPVDAIFSAARYLRAAGGHKDIRRSLFAYNRAEWYVDSVLLRARVIGGLPSDFVGSLSGLTQGRFPVAAKARYANDIDEREAERRAKRRGGSGNVSDVISGSEDRREIEIFTREGAPAVAVNDGRIVRIGESERLGKHVILEDVYGNRYTYAHLGELAERYPVPRERELSAEDFRLVRPKRDKAPREAASAKRVREEIGGDADDTERSGGRATRQAERLARQAAGREAGGGAMNSEDSRPRLFAYPERPSNSERAELTGQLDALLAEQLPGYETFSAIFSQVLSFDEETMEMRRLRKGARVQAGTMLGRVGKPDPDSAARLTFRIRPTGEGAPLIDPKPILDGWKLLESTAIYRAADENPFLPDPRTSQVGQTLLMSKSQLEQRILADPRIEIYQCGRQDVRQGRLDRRVLAVMSYLAERGYRIGVTSLRCGRDGSITTSGNVSNHSGGGAVDIATINGLPVLGNQGPGSITEALVKDVMRLQGDMLPDELISLHDMGGPSFAMADHADHVHIGYRPRGSRRTGRGDRPRILKPDQWRRLIGRLYEIDQPAVPERPSEYALEDDDD